ncbi:hypothetical protein TBLA_0D01340 [Henningerozyma blattae CBS 6284]|uniref:Autophagy-related protein 29 n=1 Tax=Henningerozyma blattae (strain ATCC 34711 / CBS 6284 / DSM 70876 / NBRC 10599 / NRRL Y-10934 / UCD 77-7) TaxID=1071380 RepID=I2H2P0_HENB6|nr:hypothetical protein TBLA_0D01340 [Tetrapisispora blattae CBS 6284]CCH60642.1 hypothetical protein TBLA_0D01340 [Tetrapisispora blattae CBS 6284]
MNNNNTIVYIRVKGKRPQGFVDPPAIIWDTQKEDQLWSIMSKLTSQKEKVDWSELSQQLDVPIDFLKQRSYKLYSNHLKILQEYMASKNDQQDTLMMRLNSEVSSTQDDSEISKKFTQPYMDPKTIMTFNDVGQLRKDNLETSNTKLVNNEKSDDTIDALKRLQSSKILNYKKPTSNNAELGENDTISTVSVSNSALEEALLDRLHL